MKSDGSEINAAEPNEKRAISKYRIAASQFCVVGALSILLFANGSGFGLITILLAELDKANPEIVATKDDLSWIGSLNYLLIPCGNLLSGLAADFFGRQRALMLLAIPYLLSWSLYHWATRVGMLYGSLALSGAAGGLLESIAITFTAEISEPRIRSALSSLAITSGNFGQFLQVLLGRFVYWRTLALINAGLTLAYLAAIIWVPESPYWLANKGRLDKAESSLAWLRGWTTRARVEREFLTLRESFPEESERSFKRYAERTFYLPLCLVSFAFFLAAFNGSNAILTYAVILLKRLGSPIDEYDATIIAELLNLVGTLIFGFVVQFTGKRRLTFFTMLLSGLAFFTSSAVTFYGTSNDRFIAIVPTLMVLSTVFLSALGINMIPYILTGEVFPIRLTKVGTGASVALFNLFQWLNNKIFLDLIDCITLEGVFLITGTINIAGCAALYFAMPETEGKTLKEIEMCFSKKKS